MVRSAILHEKTGLNDSKTSLAPQIIALPMFINLPDPGVEVCHDLIRDCAAGLCQHLNGMVLVEYDDLVANLSFGDMADIYHRHVHAYPAGNGGQSSMKRK